MQPIVPYKETIDIIRSAGGEQLYQCYQCGLCTGTCPWNLVRSFPVRKIIHQAQLGVVDFESEEIWLCTTCRSCVQRCPRGVAIIDIARAIRNVVAEVGVAKIPDSLRLSIKNIAGVGNPLGLAPEDRTEWAADLKVKPFKGSGYLYVSCCIPAYDPGVKRVARATAAVLKKLKVDFGILGTKESCCGESVRKAGNENLFQDLAARNIGNFNQAGAGKILASSPHCYHTFKNEYKDLGADFEVFHTVQLVSELIRGGNVKFTKKVNKKVAYHDSCYLGRHNGIYDEPREILSAIPGVELVEMADNRENALCCGGGGGRIWMETKKEERFSDIRLQQALDAGADVLAVSCPYCMLNFEDSLLTLGKEGVIEVKDVLELVSEAL